MFVERLEVLSNGGSLRSHTAPLTHILERIFFASACSCIPHSEHIHSSPTHCLALWTPSSCFHFLNSITISLKTFCFCSVHTHDSKYTSLQQLGNPPKCVLSTWITWFCLVYYWQRYFTILLACRVRTWLVLPAPNPPYSSRHLFLENILHCCWEFLDV